MAHSQFTLLKSRRFLPLFITQALGAFNDNGFKNALVILVTYRLASEQGLNGPLFITIAAGLFILPFFLFSATAGQLADKYEKTYLIHRIKFAEILLMGLAILSFYLASFTLGLVVLFLLGAQSTFFGPLKYGILPQHLKDDELIGGNGLIETGTFLAILLGTLFGGILILLENGLFWVSLSLMSLSILGFIASLYIPKANAPAPGLAINPNFIGESWSIMKRASEKRTVFLSILGISWFWFVGTIFLTQFPTLAKDHFFANEQVTNLFIATFTVGIMAGSLLCNKLLKGEITAKYVPLASIAITIFSLALVMLARSMTIKEPETLYNFTEFLALTGAPFILLFLFFIAALGGIYAVPLFALVQHKSDPKALSRTIAGNNIINAGFMVTASLMAAFMLQSGYGVLSIFTVTATLNALVAIYICRLLPQDLIKSIGRALFRLLYRVEIKGMENYDQVGEKAVIVANHTSFLDAPLLGCFLKDTPLFGINTHIAEKWWVKPAFALFDLYPIDPTNPMGLKGLIKEVASGKKCVIFPEGRITLTGALMKIYEGPGMIAANAGAEILPIRIDGAQYSIFSRLKGKLRLSLFPKISITILAPQTIEANEDSRGRQRREEIGRELHDVMTNMVFETSNTDRTLFESIIDAAGLNGMSHPILEDVERSPLSYKKLIIGSFVLGHEFAKFSRQGEAVGIFLPNTNGTVASFLALSATGRIPAMLNFTSGAKNLLSATTTAELKTIITSRRFIDLARLHEEEMALNKIAKLIYLEDIKLQIGFLQKTLGLIKAWCPKTMARRINPRTKPDDTAVILFTSGSEGTPKGVCLSHRNILANTYQISAKVDFTPSDLVFNALPLFHCFGLTDGTILPLVSGVKIFLYPSPLHYRIVPEAVYDTNATILFGTDTFLKGYAAKAHAYDFYALRYVFAGAEKLNAETRRTYMDNFGLRIFEGYGATETAPVISTNTAMEYKAGTVGRFLPGIEHKLATVPGIHEGGRLFVKGPNVMKGYLLEGKPGKITPPEDGWYDTGDIVEIDPDGFITIKGRAKRFAKIAGEMVSLTAIEQFMIKNWPDSNHAVVAIPCDKKGEQLILFTEAEKMNRTDILERAKNEGLSELAVPRTIFENSVIPVLGTGKLDLVALKQEALESLGISL